MEYLINQPLSTQEGSALLKALLRNCLYSLPGSLGHCLPTHLSSSFKPASFTDADAQLTVVDFESHAGDLLCYYHHGPVEGHHTRTG